MLLQLGTREQIHVLLAGMIQLTMHRVGSQRNTCLHKLTKERRSKRLTR